MAKVMLTAPRKQLFAISQFPALWYARPLRRFSSRAILRALFVSAFIGRDPPSNTTMGTILWYCSISTRLLRKFSHLSVGLPKHSSVAQEYVDRCSQQNASTA